MSNYTCPQCNMVCNGRANCPDQDYCHRELESRQGDRISIHTSPVMMDDGTNNWVPVDLLIDPDTLKPRAIPFTLSFGKRITDPGAIQYADKHGSISFHLKSHGLGGIDIPEPSGDAIVDGNKITYPLPWGRIEYEVLCLGVKETIYIDSRTLPDPTALGIPLTNLTVDYDFGLPPTPQEHQLVAWDGRGRSINVKRTGTGISIDYGDYIRARLPIVIDPTIGSNGIDSGYGVGAWFGTNNSNDLFGVTDVYTTDTKGGQYYSVSNTYRSASRFDLTPYRGYTIQAGARYQVRWVSGGSGNTPVTEQITDWGATFSNFFAATALVSLGSPGLWVTSGWTDMTVDIRNNIIQYKSGILALRCRATDESARDGARSCVNIQGGGTAVPPQLTFSAYNTFTQGAPTANADGSITLHWTNGGGLVSGDYHHIYYRQTGATQWTLLGSSVAYTDTSYTVQALSLVPGTSYDFEVVDVQVVSGTGYEGATSSTQTMVAPAQQPGSTPPVVTISSINTADAIPDTAPYRTSKQTSDNMVTVIFSVDQDITAWRVEAGGTGAGTGTTLASGGAVVANTNITANFRTTDFPTVFVGDGDYRINVYGQNSSGRWTTYQ